MVELRVLCFSLLCDELLVVASDAFSSFDYSALTLGGDVSSSTDAGILCRPSEVLLPAVTTKMRIRMPSTSA